MGSNFIYEIEILACSSMFFMIFLVFDQIVGFYKFLDDFILTFYVVDFLLSSSLNGASLGSAGWLLMRCVVDALASHLPAAQKDCAVVQDMGHIF